MVRSSIRWTDLRISGSSTISALLLFAGAATADVFPGAVWETRTPAEVGLDATKLTELENLVGGVGMVVRFGYQAYTWGDASQTFDWASASKPMITTMLFRAERLGYAGVHTPIGLFIEGGSPSDSSITFYQLGNMMSGYSRGEPADSAWAYNDYGIQLYGHVLFEEVYHQSPQDAFDAQLGFLQFEDPVVVSSVQAGRITTMSVRDFARLGLLWLNQGTWDGTVFVLAQKFVNLVRNQVPVNLPTSTLDGAESWDLGSFGGSDNQTEFVGQGNYGMCFWVNTNGFFGPAAPPDVHAAIGHFGSEVCFVMPDLDLIAVGTGSWGHPATAAVQLLREAALGPVGAEPAIEARSWGSIKGRYRSTR